MEYKHSKFTCSVSYTDEQDMSIWGEGRNDIMMRWIIFLKQVPTMDLNSWPSSHSRTKTLVVGIEHLSMGLMFFT